MKPLEIFKDRLIQNMVIVDNHLYSFGYDIDNGIPIIPFYNDCEDDQLVRLYRVLKYINK